ncbi:anaerobic ribonucleoside-triphosphate reductase activating protein [Natranaerobius thermophilus]|uniref:Anaerobic ribonucleoside-triphosphate reductase-activating protein n=1 Tax=Natranaerobius thermophilus (strain ATCC BAA-1301 / DSM 18059 / JW/NM-WN-LF) TaxID=457570 RepID=B2A3U9_NATTJ|nr:anaerobic ribonucleoside-triphosphate reductase activating protein [Natranaerobius thermophilus]ACB83725.1 anaerobic ribonucleoside-triphosphate reductase activating protein [Natranaerobius thermophilus JW/NM-WN-LF]
MDENIDQENHNIIKIAGIIPECVVNAPGGISYVIFAQGCAHKCPGCHNPETHDFNAGEEWRIDEILTDLKNYPLSGIVTFTGGDPFFQAKSFHKLAVKLKELNYTIVAYSGFYFEELKNDMDKKNLLSHVDILIDGPYLEEQKQRDLNFRGSLNQRILDVKNSIIENNPVILNKYYEKS